MRPVERAILLTLVYADLFDYPLTDDELYRYLVRECPSRDEFDQALASLLESSLVRRQGYVTWASRQETVALRRERQERATQRWSPALRYAHWLSRVPFTRMVAVCGSQAVENPRPDADIDFFCITEPGRLWIVQIWAMWLRRIGRFFSLDVCPNYFLALDALEVEAKDLYTAHEVVQVVPLWGGEAYERFVAANAWIRDFLPNFDFAAQRRFLVQAPRRRLARLGEAVLRGRLGDALDRAVHRLLLLYYPRRLRRRGLSREEFARSYRRDRQLVVTGGYARAVARRFVQQARQRLGADLVMKEVEGLFPGATREPGPDADPLYSELLDQRYGAGRG